MDGFYSFLFFVAIIILNVLFQSAKRKERRKNSPPQSFPKERKQSPKQPLDYMMAKPKPQQETTRIYREPEFIKKEPEGQYDINNVYQEYLKHKETYYKPKRTEDYIQRTEIQSTDTKKDMKINIERTHIMNAIMYAQVLEQPKSVLYLKRRYNIKRVMHKD